MKQEGIFIVSALIVLTPVLQGCNRSWLPSASKLAGSTISHFSSSDSTSSDSTASHSTSAETERSVEGDQSAGINGVRIRKHLSDAGLIRRSRAKLISLYERGISIPSYDFDELRTGRMHYEKVLAMQPAHLEAILGLANLELMEAMTYLALKEELEAKAEITSPNASSKDRLEVMRYERRISLATQAARNKFERIIAELSPSDPGAHLGIAISLVIDGELEQALRKFRENEESGVIHPKLPNVSVAYGWYGFALERASQPERAFDKYMAAAAIRDPYEWGAWAEARIDNMNEKKMDAE